MAAVKRHGDLTAEAYARRGLSGAYRFLGRDEESRTELKRSEEILAESAFPSVPVSLSGCTER